jgi:2-oxoglutarate dehydrogenase E1 component
MDTIQPSTAADDGLNLLSLPFAEGLYADYLRDPRSVPDEWQRYFATFPGANGLAELRTGPSFPRPRLFQPPTAAPAARAAEEGSLPHRLLRLIDAYRLRGHAEARVDPLEQPRPAHPDLDPRRHGIGEADLDRPAGVETAFGPASLSVREVIARARGAWCGPIGMLYMHIDEPEIREWLQTRIERAEHRPPLARAEKIRVLERLTESMLLEEFIHTKYVGAKTYSVRGSEMLIPLLDFAVERAGEAGIDELVLAMAHRGRISVLTSILGRPAREAFRRLEDAEPERWVGRGDVRFHDGYSRDWKSASGKSVHLSLCLNPSHLEFVNPVALGRVRAKLNRVGDRSGARCMAVLIHGDAALIGQGINQEILNYSRLVGYQTGGSLHVITNNQLGFTTQPEASRSTTYSASIARMLDVPLLLVNGEDPEAVVHAVRLAVDFRQTFRRDVVLDVHGYRRYGHNEVDEPTFTQPALYRQIRARQPIRDAWRDHLVREGELGPDEAEAHARRWTQYLEAELAAARQQPSAEGPRVRNELWSRHRGGADRADSVPTGVPQERLSELLEAMSRPPQGFHVHPKLERFLEQRRAMARGEALLDWGAAEALAFATLAAEGYRIRLSGQDSERGTFGHRHATMHDFETGHPWRPLQGLPGALAPVEVYNSPLSEPGIMGFEYGYSLDYPDALVAWEAQFGDFHNTGQVIVDQFVVGGELKWNRLSGLVLLLPHGLDGVGPEHSSARLERFLAMAVQDNIRVVHLSTPAQYFHCLRRQVVAPERKPLVVMAPKSLLRLPQAVSTLSELAEGRFHRVLPDVKGAFLPVERIYLSSAKTYHELERRRGELGRSEVALLRVEQLFPLCEADLEALLRPYAEGTPVCWVQEEPENMGAWPYLRLRFGERLLGRHPFEVISRPASPNPATGSAAAHKLEHARLLERALPASG